MVDENFAVHRDHKHTSLQGVLLIDSEPSEPVISVDDSSLPSALYGRSSVAAAVPEEPAVSSEPAVLRRSRRSSVPPDRLSFAAVKSDPKPEEDDEPIPHTLTEGLAGKHAYQWLKGTNNEMGELIDREVIKMPEPDEELGKAMGSRLVFDKQKKFNLELGKHIKFKARHVIKGFSSIKGVHYDKTYSPTVLFKSLLLILNIAQLQGWYKTSIDIGNAYLEAEVKRPLCMWLPLDWTQGKRVKVKLVRNLYGLKDAGLMWYLLVIEVLTGMGYVRSIYDPCIFYILTKKDGVTSIIAVFVDDMSLNGNKKADVERVKQRCGEIFKKITDMGELKKFLGIEFEEDLETGHLVLTQVDATNQYIAAHLLNGSVVKNVPIAPSHVLESVDKTADEADNQPIWDIVGKIRYLSARTPPDHRNNNK